MRNKHTQAKMAEIPLRIPHLTRGDHIFCKRSHARYTYSHHGIYVGNNQVIHFSGTEKDSYTTFKTLAMNDADIDKEMKEERDRHNKIFVKVPWQEEYHKDTMRKIGKKRKIHIRKTTLNEFQGSDDLEVAQYDEANARYSCVKSIDPKKTVQLAESYNEDPHRWPKYDLYSNNCETFACYCKTGLRSGVQLQLHPENYC